MRRYARQLAALISLVGGSVALAPLEGTEVPAPEATARGRPGLFLDLGLGVTALNARWVGHRGPDPDYRASVYGLEMAVRARVGLAINRRLALFLDGRAEVPVPPMFFAWPTIAEAGIGAGVIWFPREEGTRYLEIVVRRAWARGFERPKSRSAVNNWLTPFSRSRHGARRRSHLS